MKYYVNVFFPGDELPELPCNYNYIGLFTEKQYKGVGYFCGGYNSAQEVLDILLNNINSGKLKSLLKI